MSRRKAREIALQALYEIEYNDQLPHEACTRVFSLLDFEDAPVEAAFSVEIVSGVRLNIEKIDELITRFSDGWEIDRMPAVDRNIIRIAIFEMQYAEDKLSPGIAINEAVELAKTYGTDETKKFVNGLLSSVVKKYTAEIGE
ncbi:MAG: transcription antitermination factor NusB [Negativicutes bacterium]|jgi:N utilization substance protein B